MDYSVSSDILCELLEVAIHLILYTREVYPTHIFRRKKKYNIPVQMCIYPELKEYISNCICSVKPYLENGSLEKLIIAIKSCDEIILEKFVFEIKQESFKPIDIKNENDLNRLEEALRAFILKLSISDSLLKSLPSNCTFTVQIQVPTNVETNNDYDFPWVEEDKTKKIDSDSVVIPLKNLNTNICQMQLYIEQKK